MTRLATERIAARPRPPGSGGFVAGLRRRYFATPLSGATSLLLALAAAWFAWAVLDWGVLRAVFSTGSAGPDACRVDGVGACWAVVGEKVRLIVFGLYPPAWQWRPALAMVILLAAVVAATRRSLWNWRLAVVWLVALGLCAALMRGGVAGLPIVPEDQWGGLPVTLLLATLGLAAGFPLAVLLALARHQTRGGIGKAIAVAVIELVRSVPLLAVLFLASVMVPLFLPQGMDVSKLLRVLAAFVLFTAAYLAEVIRGGLHAVPRGQFEAAAALGLSPATTTLRVVLPQALAAVLPALVNVFIAFFKATSIVVVVGIFDLMTAAKRAVADPAWQGFGTEVYLFVGAIYFVFCHAMSRYSASLQAADPTARRP